MPLKHEGQIFKILPLFTQGSMAVKFRIGLQSDEHFSLAVLGSCAAILQDEGSMECIFSLCLCKGAPVFPTFRKKIAANLVDV